ncbi:MAG: hypothetical protein KDC83_05405 [Flavobacteriales bacterium]|nr:hypothetical protein [Flavobacteriales bacterium]
MSIKWFATLVSFSLMGHWSLAQQNKWVIHTNLVDYMAPSAAPLHIGLVPVPTKTQNGLTNDQGTLEFYAADGGIYDANGMLIHQQFEPRGTDPALGWSEFIFVPVPEECDEFYAINTYNLGTTSGNVGNFLIYSRIKKINGIWSAQTMPNSTLTEFYENNSCSFSRSDGLGSGPETSTQLFHNHLAVTRENQQGNRYLFMSLHFCIGAFEIRNDDIHYLGSSQKKTSGPHFQINNRSEMEVYEYPFEGTEKYSLSTCYFSEPNLAPNNEGGAVHIFDVEFNGNTPNFTSDYQVEVPTSDPNDFFLNSIKGLEFSEDGLTLYASIIRWDKFLSTINDDQYFVYFTRALQSNNFAWGGVILSGYQNREYGKSQIERGIDGRIYLAGDYNLGTLQDNNDPNSTWTPSYIDASHGFTNLLTGSVMDPLDYLYFLPDQIDGEDYNQWRFGAPDLFPDRISDCEFPIVLNSPGSFHVQVNDLYPPHNSIVYSGVPSFIISRPSQVLLSSSFDFSCAETLIVECCPAPGTEMLCGNPVIVTKSYDYVNNEVTLCASTCTTDVPAPCIIQWSFDYPIPGKAKYASANFNGHSFCHTIPLLDPLQYHQHSVLHLRKVMCFGDCSGEDVELLMDEEWDLYDPNALKPIKVIFGEAQK